MICEAKSSKVNPFPNVIPWFKYSDPNKETSVYFDCPWDQWLIYFCFIWNGEFTRNTDTEGYFGRLDVTYGSEIVDMKLLNYPCSTSNYQQVD